MSLVRKKQLKLSQTFFGCKKQDFIIHPRRKTLMNNDDDDDGDDDDENLKT